MFAVLLYQNCACLGMVDWLFGLFGVDWRTFRWHCVWMSYCFLWRLLYVHMRRWTSVYQLLLLHFTSMQVSPNGCPGTNSQSDVRLAGAPETSESFVLPCMCACVVIASLWWNVPSTYTHIHTMVIYTPWFFGTPTAFFIHSLTWMALSNCTCCPHFCMLVYLRYITFSEVLILNHVWKLKCLAFQDQGSVEYLSWIQFPHHF